MSLILGAHCIVHAQFRRNVVGRSSEGVDMVGGVVRSMEVSRSGLPAARLREPRSGSEEGRAARGGAPPRARGGCQGEVAKRAKRYVRFGRAAVKFPLSQNAVYIRQHTPCKRTPSGASVKLGTIQRRLAWPLRKDDTHNSRGSGGDSTVARWPMPPPTPKSLSTATDNSDNHDSEQPSAITVTKPAYLVVGSR